MGTDEPKLKYCYCYDMNENKHQKKCFKCIQLLEQVQ